MLKNLVLSEVEFNEFRQFCRERGFDLSYFGPEFSGSKEEIERHQFDSPKVIKLVKRRFAFRGTPYDVAIWQREKWMSNLSEIYSEFLSWKQKQSGLSQMH